MQKAGTQQNAGSQGTHFTTRLSGKDLDAIEASFIVTQAQFPRAYGSMQTYNVIVGLSLVPFFENQ